MAREQMYHGVYGNYGMTNQEVDLRDALIKKLLDTKEFDDVISIGGKTMFPALPDRPSTTRMALFVELNAPPTSQQLVAISKMGTAYTRFYPENIHKKYLLRLHFWA